MAFGKDRAEWWRRFLGRSPDGSRKTVEILRRRYVEERQQVNRLEHHAQQMQYPQFCEKLLRMTTEKASTCRVDCGKDTHAWG
jgi:hypothetical protein